MTANRPRPGMSGNTLFGMMGAIVAGAAAEEQAKRLSLDTGTPCCEFHDPDAEDIQCCDDCPIVEAEQQAQLERAQFEADWGLACAQAQTAASVAALDVHAALNTYEVASGVPEQIAHPGPEMISVIGANRRRLIVRRDADGLWVGGCLITDREVAEGLAAFITREDDE